LPPELGPFAFHLWVAVLLGGVLGVRTNVLVAVGACLFVSMSHRMGDGSDPTRIVSYVVSGIGFLAGGVILKEGATVRGMNTAATVWCSAAVGSLCGAGYPAEAVFGTTTILLVHLGLRPVARYIDRHRPVSPNVETAYRIKVVCDEKDEGVIRHVILRHVNGHGKLSTQGIETKETDRPDITEVVADVIAPEPQDRAIQDIISRLNIEPGVKALSWHKMPRQAD
jgi:putative Mg2+ transporter-C (MgtC) family protein